MGPMKEGPPSRNRLIILCGLSFAGKSTLADAICAEFGYPQVDVDETKWALHGPGVEDEALSPEERARIYRETDEQIRMHLRKGDSVVDASRNFRQSERIQARALAEVMGAETVLINVDTPEAIVRQRWTENRAQPTRRQVSPQGFEENISVMEPPTAEEEATVFHHEDNINSWLAEHSADLRGTTGPR